MLQDLLVHRRVPSGDAVSLATLHAMERQMALILNDNEALRRENEALRRELESHLSGAVTGVSTGISTGMSTGITNGVSNAVSTGISVIGTPTGMATPTAGTFGNAGMPGDPDAS